MMLTASVEAGEFDEDSACLAIRFCHENNVKHTVDLMIRQIRDRYMHFWGMKPKEIRREVSFTLWKIPTEIKHGGWPIYMCPASDYY